MINFSKFTGKQKKYKKEFREGFNIKETHREKILRERREAGKENLKKLIPFRRKVRAKPKYRYTTRKRIYL